MKINFTKKEYHLLIDMLYLSDWIMYSHSTSNKDSDYKQLRKRILSFYKEMDATDCVEYSKEFDNYFEKQPYDTQIHEEFIDPYDDETFWNELIERLAVRDVILQIGETQYQLLDGMERVKKVSIEIEKYENEFEEHGLINLKVSYKKSDIN